MAVPSTNDYCEIWRPRAWRAVTVQYALSHPGGLLRCIECHGAVRPHTAGPRGIPRAHAEHRVGHPGCSLGHYFDGTKTPHPNPVQGSSSGTDSTAIGTVAVEDDESAFPEGSVTFRIHHHLERDGALPRRAKAARLRESGTLACEVCSFDFGRTYGAIGDGFIEAHHRIAVSELTGNESTRLSDLALVCSNCHRMLHRADPQLSIEQLRSLVQKNAT